MNVRYLIITCSLLLLLNGCSTTKHSRALIEQLDKSNAQAQKVVTGLKNVYTESEKLKVNYTEYATSKLGAGYYAAKLELVNQVVTLKDQAREQMSMFTDKCDTTIESQAGQLATQVNASKNKAERLYAEHQTRIEDKLLELQAAKQTADYFGSLSKYENILRTTLRECTNKMKAEFDQSLAKIEGFKSGKDKQLDKLYEDSKKSIEDIKLAELLPYEDSYNALLMWHAQQDIAFDQLGRYTDTINPLSSKGATGSIVKGLKQSLLTAVACKENCSGSVRDAKGNVIESIKGLLDSATDGYKDDIEDFKESVQEDGKEILDGIKSRLKDVFSNFLEERL